MTLTLPLPPVMNHYWRSMAFRGQVRIYLSPKGRAYKQAVRLQSLAERWPLAPPPVALAITFYEARRGTDADARIKALFDALTGALYADDGHIVTYHVRRNLDHRRPRVEVTVLTLEGPTETCGCAKCASKLNRR